MLLTAFLYAPAQQAPQPPGAIHQKRSIRFVQRRGISRAGGSAVREPPAAALIRVRAQNAVMAHGAAQAPVPTWQPVGPSQVATSLYGLVTGRITSIAADPSDPTGNTVYFGSSGGGVWKSTNANASPSTVTFAPATDTVPPFTPPILASLSIGALSVQPGGTGVVLAGTGDPNDATDSWYGAGLLRSTDGGNTWSMISRTAQQPSGFMLDFIGNAFSGFAWSTTNPNLVVAAVSQSEYSSVIGLTGQLNLLGLYYSLDAGPRGSLQPSRMAQR